MPVVPATGVWVDANSLATQWLSVLHLPNTASNRKALAAWFFAESRRRGNDVYVVGNNPLNITTGSSGNYRLVGTHRIAVFGSPDAGINAFNSLIHHNAYGYPAIWAALAKGGNNGVDVINAITHSGWVTGSTKLGSYWHTTHGKRSNLLESIYSSLTGATFNDAGVLPHDNPGGDTSLSAWAYGNTPSGFTLPVGHIITSSDVEDMLKFLQNKGIVSEIGPDVAIVRGILTMEIGKPWNDALLQDIQAKFLQASGLAGHDLNPISVAADAAGSVIGVVTDAIGKFFGSIIPIMALLGGGLMAMGGIYLITKEATATTGAAESLVSPVPVFLRKDA